ncbi:MAG: hypothetical protein ACYC27_09625 [Armatimonadota bacterium]
MPNYQSPSELQKKYGCCGCGGCIVPIIVIITAVVMLLPRIF